MVVEALILEGIMVDELGAMMSMMWLVRRDD